MQPTEPGKTEKATGYVTEYVTEKAEKKNRNATRKAAGNPGERIGNTTRKGNGRSAPGQKQI